MKVRNAKHRYRGGRVNSIDTRPNKFNITQGFNDEDDDNMQLVPCRWAKSGWKYVNADPSQTRYFNSPNRVNSFGMNNIAEK